MERFEEHEKQMETLRKSEELLKDVSCCAMCRFGSITFGVSFYYGVCIVLRLLRASYHHFHSAVIIGVIIINITVCDADRNGFLFVSTLIWYRFTDRRQAARAVATTGSGARSLQGGVGSHTRR